ncbi:MAG: hypothetical protein SVU32_01130, partial [Candidatus Nanohaloarchaea archaeon]|nr:hypothetical protein [Candidatus Nanohaloarchaea archaeon]
NEQVVRGLIAHELMHTVQRSRGLGEEVEEAGQAYTDTAVANIMERGYSKEEALHFVREVLSTAILCLKDIHANTELIRQGFSKELEEYYYQMLDIDDFCAMPEFYDEEETFDDLVEAIAFDIRLIPAWLPFEGLDRERSREIKDRINECYKVNIPQTSYHVDQIRHLYHDSFQDTEEFNTKFFSQILDASYRLIDEKLGDG